MIIVMKQHATLKDIENVENRLIELGFKTHLFKGIDSFIFEIRKYGVAIDNILTERCV